MAMKVMICQAKIFEAQPTVAGFREELDMDRARVTMPEGCV